MKYGLGITIIAFFIFGCSSSITEIKDKKIEITIPKVHDVIPAKIVDEGIKEYTDAQLDSINNLFPKDVSIEGEKEVIFKDQPTKVKVKYSPKKKEFDVSIDSHKATATYTDTTKTIKKEEIKVSEKFGYAAMGAIVFVVISIGLFLLWKLK